MKTTIKILTFTLSTLLLNFQNTFAQCHIDDWTALKALYESTNGDNWFNNTGWQEITGNTPTANCNLGNLYGVSLDENERVTCIDMDGEADCAWISLAGGNNLTGYIPTEIGNLSYLTSLNLIENKLSGSISPELVGLSNLEQLLMSNNQLSGTIPQELGNISNLKFIYLSKNQLSGDIPSDLGNLNNLERLNLYANQLSGSIPAELGNLEKLTTLRLENNQLNGSIPDELGELSDLTLLYLNSNLLNNSIPSELGNLNNLTVLSLYQNQLNGSIPSTLGNLSSLKDLSLFTNQFTGSIPSELGNLSNLTNLRIWNNQLSGSIPVELANLSNLMSLSLSNNQLSGNIPSELGILSNLTSLSLDRNQLNGSIPPELGNLSELEVLNLYTNELNGSIPSELGNLSDLEKLRLSTNEFNGSIPSELSNLSNLTMLTVNNNDLNGCYSNNLSILCTQLTSEEFEGNADISENNNFDAPWEDFCATSAGACIDCVEDCETDVYPGDLNHDGIVNNQDISLSGLFHYNSGTPRVTEHQNIDWYPHPSQDWGILNNQNKDLKHHDCNGDGVIDEVDQQAVENNMGFTWQSVDPTPPPPESDYLVLLNPIDQVIDGYLIMNVVLERRANTDLEVQGGYFTIDYSEIEGNISFVTLGFFDESWLGERDVNVWYESIEFPLQQKIDVGFTKTDNVSSNGNGDIGQLILAFDNNAAKRTGDVNISYQFSVNNIGIHNSNTQFTPVENQLLLVNINSTCQPNWAIDEETPFQNEYKSSGNIITDGFVLIGAEQEVEYQANRVTLNSGFKAKAGANFRAEFGSCN